MSVAGSAGPMDGLGARIGLFLYGLAGHLAAPFLGRYLQVRCKRGRESPERLDERYGRASLARPPGPLIWIHASSIGESLSTLALIDSLRERWPNVAILLTTGTVTSAEMMAERLPKGVLHQFVPLDLKSAVERFYRHWRPNLGLIVESEIWPNLIAVAAAENVPVVGINARMSKGSYRRWLWAKPLTQALLGSFALVLAQSEEDRRHFARLGAPRCLCYGNLKFAAAPLKADAAELARVEQQLGSRLRWLAASTHPGEEEQIARVHRTLAQKHPDLVTLLVPRHPRRGEEIERLLKERGLRICRRSTRQGIEPDCEIYLADSLGELGLWFRIAEIVFVGKTLVAKGGHNPLEPAKLNCAVLYGPHSDNFSKIAEEMTAAGALRRVADADELAEAVGELLDDQNACDRLAEAGMVYANAQKQVLEKVIEDLAPLVEGIVKH